MTASNQLAVDGGRPVRETFLVFGAPLIGQQEMDEVADSLRSGWIGTGPKVSQFESMFRNFVGAPHAVAVSSCTAALHLSMIAAGVGPGDEVITTPMTFVATANAIVHVGATPVFVDVQADTMNIDPDRIETAISPRTRAILPVHFAGRPCDMDRIDAVAKRHGLLVINDAAHCIEGMWHARPIGTLGDLTCFSFYVTKNMTTVEGGMVTTANEEWASIIKISALHGLSADAWSRYSDEGFRHYQATAPGFKYNMTDVQASLGIHQLPRLNEWSRRREELWRRYDDALRDLPASLPSPPSPEIVHARHLYTMLLDLEHLRVGRDDVLTALSAENIGCGVHYVGVHLHDYYRKRYNLDSVEFPNATSISERTISIPLSPKLSDEHANSVIEGVRKVLSAYAR